MVSPGRLSSISGWGSGIRGRTPEKYPGEALFVANGRYPVLDAHKTVAVGVGKIYEVINLDLGPRQDGALL